VNLLQARECACSRITAIRRGVELWAGGVFWALDTIFLSTDFISLPP